jgi:hypothetical protein
MNILQGIVSELKKHDKLTVHYISASIDIGPEDINRILEAETSIFTKISGSQYSLKDNNIDIDSLKTKNYPQLPEVHFFDEYENIQGTPPPLENSVVINPHNS